MLLIWWLAFFLFVLADPLVYWYQSLFHSPVPYLPMQLFLITEARM